MFTGQERDSFFYPQQGDKKERYIVVDSFQVEIEMRTIGAGPGEFFQPGRPGLKAADQDHTPTIINSSRFYLGPGGAGEFASLWF